MVVVVDISDLLQSVALCNCIKSSWLFCLLLIYLLSCT